jgi:hypothetical protein
MTGHQEVPGRKRRSKEIKRLVLEYEASGLRQNEFCRNHGLALSSLQRQLKRRRLDKAEPKQGSRLVAVSKFADHLALRQSVMLERETGLEISRATLDGWGYAPDDLVDVAHFCAVPTRWVRLEASRSLRPSRLPGGLKRLNNFGKLEERCD